MNRCHRPIVVASSSRRRCRRAHIITLSGNYNTSRKFSFPVSRIHSTNLHDRTIYNAIHKVRDQKTVITRPIPSAPRAHGIYIEKMHGRLLLRLRRVSRRSKKGLSVSQRPTTSPHRSQKVVFGCLAVSPKALPGARSSIPRWGILAYTRSCGASTAVPESSRPSRHLQFVITNSIAVRLLAQGIPLSPTGY